METAGYGNLFKCNGGWWWCGSSGKMVMGNGAVQPNKREMGRYRCVYVAWYMFYMYKVGKVWVTGGRYRYMAVVG